MRHVTELWRVGCLFAGVGLLCCSCGLLIELPEPVDGDDDDFPWGGASGEGSGGRGDASLGGSGASEMGQGGEGSTSGGGTAITSGTGGMGGALPEGCAKHCDCDDDGAVATGECGGDDCDDEDERVFPGQTAFFTERSENDAVGFDFDCSGSLERPAGQTDAVNCAQLALGACEDGQGFLGTLPACGNPGSWGSCFLATAVSCEEDVADDEKVASCH